MSEEDYKSVGAIKNQWVETKDEYLDMALNVIDNLKIKNQQLKEIIEEVREALSYIDDDIMATCKNYDVNGIELKKILDKIKGEKNENS